MPSEITLKQISQSSGFSISTISKALNDKRDVNKETKAKVKEIAKKLNYIPNSSALALRNRETKIIGVIVPKINSKIYGNIISKIQVNAFKRGYRIILLQSLACEDRELECINNVSDGCIDGLILVRPIQKDNDKINKILSINGTKLPTELIYINAKSSINMHESKSLGKKYLNKLLRQINQQF